MSFFQGLEIRWAPAVARRMGTRSVWLRFFDATGTPIGRIDLPSQMAEAMLGFLSLEGAELRYEGAENVYAPDSWLGTHVRDKREPTLGTRTLDQALEAAKRGDAAPSPEPGRSRGAPGNEPK